MIKEGGLNMLSWCFTHPVFTFIIIITALWIIGLIFEDIITVSNNKLKIRELEINNKIDKEIK